MLKRIGIAEMLKGAWRHLEMLEDTRRCSETLEDALKWKSSYDMRLERAKGKWYHNGKESILKFENRMIGNRT